MNCKEVQNRLVSYIHGEVTPSEKRLIAAHLSGCPECRAELESTQSIENQIRRHIQRRAVQAAAPASGWQALQAKLEAEPGRGGASRNWQVFFPGLSWNGRRLAAASFLVILALFALVPAVRAQVQAQIQEIAGDWFHFSAPGGQSQAEIGGFSAFTPYHATYLPEGFQLSGMGGSSAPDKETITLGYNNQEKFVDLAQSAGTHLDALPQGEHLVVNGSTAVFVEDFARSARELQEKIPAISIVIEYDYTHTNLLVWDMGEIRMQMVSNLPKDEILRIAGSLAPMESGQLPAAPDAGSRNGALELLIIVLFGWAGIGLGLALAALGLLKRSLALSISGVLLGLPFSLYLLATPRGWLPGLLIPACLAFSAWTAGAKRQARQGWLSLLLAAGAAAVIFLLTR